MRIYSDFLGKVVRRLRVQYSGFRVEDFFPSVSGLNRS